jgi:hypothetical protein
MDKRLFTSTVPSTLTSKVLGEAETGIVAESGIESDASFAPPDAGTGSSTPLEVPTPEIAEPPTGDQLAGGCKLIPYDAPPGHTVGEQMEFPFELRPPRLARLPSCSLLMNNSLVLVPGSGGSALSR